MGEKNTSNASEYTIKVKLDGKDIEIAKSLSDIPDFTLEDDIPDCEEDLPFGCRLDEGFDEDDYGDLIDRLNLLEDNVNYYRSRHKADMDRIAELKSAIDILATRLAECLEF